MDFHISTALDYMKRSKMVRHMETKLKDTKTETLLQPSTSLHYLHYICQPA